MRADIALVLNTKEVAENAPEEHVIVQLRAGRRDAEVSGMEENGGEEAGVDDCHVVLSDVLHSGE